MKMVEISGCSDVELRQKELDLRNELAALRLKKQVGQVEKTHLFSELKKSIARVMFAKSKRSGGAI